MSTLTNPAVQGVVNPGQGSDVRPFSLSDVDGLVWLPDPDDPGVILNSGEVRTLPDATDPAEDAEQTTAANQPTFVESDSAANGRSTVRYVSANGDFLTAGDNHDPGAQAFSLFIPLRVRGATGSFQRFIDKRGTGSPGTQAGYFGRYEGETAGGDSQLLFGVDDGGGNGLLTTLSSVSGVSLLDGSMHLVELHWDASTGTFTANIDRQQITQQVDATIGSIDTARELVLGCAWDAAATQSQFFDGWIGKVAMYLRGASVGPVSGAALTAVRNDFTRLYGTP